VPSHRTRLPSPAAQAETLYLKGMHLLRQERGVEAEPLLQQALQLDPGHAFARQALASVWIGEGRTLATEALLQQGLQIAPAESGWAMLLARLQVERGDRQAAIQTLRNSLAEASPLAVRHADPHAFLAALLQRQGDHDEAVARFTTALRLVPDKGIWWMGLGISLQAAGHAQQATAAYERALNANGLPAHLRAFVEQRLQQVSP
jgi:MSHA biogenesis protein MshN